VFDAAALDVRIPDRVAASALGASVCFADTYDDIAHARFLRLAARRDLSVQEGTVCYHLLRGLASDKAIAEAMRRSPQTIKNHMNRIHQALGVQAREQVVLTLWPLYRRARAAAAGGAPCSTG
jgi:DNA-binding NarL/FixJ family response regulator